MGNMAKLVFKHAITGKVAELPAHYEHHPVLGKHLERVDGPADSDCAPCQAEVEPESADYAEELSTDNEEDILYGY